jgi:hypothetical protein
MNSTVLLAIAVALLGGGGIGGVVVAFSGVAKDILARRKDAVIAQVARDKEERETANMLITQAMSMVTLYVNQVKEARAEAATDAAHYATEMQAMRDQIRLLTVRVAELETEKAKDEYEKKQLKSRIYDLEHGVRTRPTRKTNTPL